MTEEKAYDIILVFESPLLSQKNYTRVRFNLWISGTEMLGTECLGQNVHVPL